MTGANDLLVEIGTEELPPKALRGLSEAFAAELKAEIAAGFDAAGFAHGAPVPYATPRRLAVLVPDVPGTQPDREVVRRGPPLARAFDDKGEPTRAALGFAKKVGVDVDRLVRLETGAGAWLAHRFTETGATLASLLPGMLERALERLPAPRRMRWADRDTEFVRPVHWVVLMHGGEVVEAEILGVRSGRVTRGHRFHHDFRRTGGIALEHAGRYEAALRDEGRIVAGFEARMETIREQVEREARALGGRALIDPALLEENTALVEWPVAVAGHFDAAFLALPDAVLTATMQGHQRYFPVAGDDGALMPHFIAVSNIESRDVETVRKGNERVIRPRLSDAAYFFDADCRRSLESRLEGLEGVVFQRELGTLHAKARRVSMLAGRVAEAMDGSSEAVAHARRAGLLSKCDLLTEMVGEFPELQGRMGCEYARRDGEPEAVAAAIGEVYLPRFADDAIPATAAGRAVAIADKLDTLAGIFGIGQAPSGDKDPYALRRAALGVLRIIIEAGLDLDLDEMIEAAFEGYAGEASGIRDSAAGVHRFMIERLRAWFADRSISADVFNAVLKGVFDKPGQPTRPLDFAHRVRAVEAFRALPEAASLAAANKRIRNILRQAEQAGIDVLPFKPEASSPLGSPPSAFPASAEPALPRENGDPNGGRTAEHMPPRGGSGSADAADPLLREDAERSLAAMLAEIEPRARGMLDAGEYTGALTTLAGLRDGVDAFFDTVKVMDDDEKARGNRLALLARIGALFMETADISLLQPAGE